MNKGLQCSRAEQNLQGTPSLLELPISAMFERFSESHTITWAKTQAVTKCLSAKEHNKAHVGGGNEFRNVPKNTSLPQLSLSPE